MIKWIGIIVLCLLLVGSASGATLTVDDSGGAMYTRIQDATNNASAGDTILVYSGTYYENVNVNKQLILRGIDSGGGKPVVNASGSGSAIMLSVDGITLERFIATNSGDYPAAGIKVISNNNVLTNNIASNNGWSGINIDHSSNNFLKGNNATGNGYLGISLYRSFNNTITGNNATTNNWGITVHDGSNNNTINGNNVKSNNEGIVILFASSNNPSSYSSNNIIYNNNLVDNSNNNAYDVGINNHWDSGIIGNHYSNYDEPSEGCTDSDSNGICDSGYNIPGGSSVDRYPLVSWSPTAPAPSNSIGYSATVATGQNTYVQSSNGTFGLLLKGQTKTINNSVILNNTGDISAKVEARFNDSRGGVFGLVSGANVLNATNFALGLPSSLVPLNNSGAYVLIAVASPGVTALDARLAVPSDQQAGDYSGTVILTFSNSV